MYYYYATVFLIFGAVIGSFLNVCVYRIPLGISVAKGRSYCDNCHHQLGPLDLIPVFSFIFLHGRCRYCKQPIDRRLPFVEAGNAILYVLCYLKWGLSLLAAVNCLLMSVLLVMALIDYDTHNVYTGPLVAFGCGSLILILLQPSVFTYHLYGALVMSLPLLAVYLLSHKTAIGTGDIWLAALAGSYLGPLRIILAIGGGYVLAALCLAPRLIRLKLDLHAEIAMFPFLAIGIACSMFFGQAIVNWYLQLLV